VTVSAEDRLRGLIALTTEAIVAADEEQRIVLFNRGAEEMFGYAADEAIGQPLTMLLPERAAHSHGALVRGVMAEGDVARRMSDRSTVLGRRRNGEEFEARISISSLRIGDGAVVTAIVHDLSAFRATEEALRRSERRYRAIFDGSPIGIFVVSQDGAIMECNASFAGMLGATDCAAVLGQSLRGRFAKPAAWDGFVGALRARGHYPSTDHTITRPDGRVEHLLISAIRDSTEPSGGADFHGFAVDVSERRRLEAAVRQANQMDAVGKLAGGIAHDFNNQLSVIRLSASFIGDRKNLDSESRHDLERVQDAARRASDLTQELLAFGRRQVLQPKTIDLVTVVGRLRFLLARIVGEDVALSVHLPKETVPIVADETQIERVLVNLAANARDAMPSGGTIEVVVAVLQDGDGPWNPGLNSGEKARLTVRDSGTGMTEETRAHIFDPFFARGDDAPGAGLGLATVDGIVAQSGGSITVESAPGEGTAFHLWFPIAPSAEGIAASRRSESVPRAADPAAPLTGTVLLVEDEHHLREAIERVLRRRGLTVLSADGAPAALQHVSRFHGRIDLVISDVVMPGMSGQALVEQIARQRSGIRVLFMSGYSNEAVRRHGQLWPGSELLAKPFAPAELVARVERLLALR
jgi:hypothetical protein